MLTGLLIGPLVVSGVLVGCDAGSGPPTDRPAQADGRTQPEAPTPAVPTRIRPSVRTPDPPASPAPSPPARRQAVLDERLRAAAWRNDLPAARRLVRLGADVDAEDETQQSAYLIAASEGYLGLLRLALRRGAAPASLDSYHGTALIRAAERGHAHVVGRLLTEPIDVDHVNELGWTALHEAVILGDGSTRYVDTLRALVAGGSDVALPSRDDGLTARQHALAAGQAVVARTLGRSAAAPRPRDPDRALLRAAWTGDADGVALALRAGAHLEARDDRGRTALLRAALRDRVPVARLLVCVGADPDARDDRQDTPWLVTGVTGSVAMAEALLPAHPDLSRTNRFGGTSLIPASERGHVAYVRRVLRTPIDVDHVNALGWTALLEAVVLGDGSRPYQRIVDALLAAGADPRLADSAGATPLQLARARDQTAIARLLAAAGSPARR